jgi:arsenate reductase (thioredoxin)
MTTTPDHVFNILFLCTGNSARSLLGESIVDRLGQGRFKGFSAGSQPRGAPHPYTLDLLKGLGLSVEGLRSKSWDEFATAGAPRMDFIFTVCDDAAGEACPVWLGQPMTAHWGIPDPAAAEGSEIERRAAFRQAYAALENRIKLFISLQLANLDGLSLQRHLDAIGRELPAASAA